MYIQSNTFLQRIALYLHIDYICRIKYRKMAKKAYTFRFNENLVEACKERKDVKLGGLTRFIEDTLKEKIKFKAKK